MSQQWEYKVVTGKRQNGGHDFAETEYLNSQGAKGWELVSYARLGLEFEHLIFKRKLKP